MKTLRLACEADAESILALYAPYIKNTAVTFECEVPSLDEFRDRIKLISYDYPYVVCESDGKIIGYAYAHRQKERAAYQWNAELSVYVDPAGWGCGTGKILYGALIEILKLQKVRNVYGVVTFPNKNSEKLHEHFGFKMMGIYCKTGYKCGRWHDVACFEKNIALDYLEPQPFIPISKIDADSVRKILAGECMLPGSN